ncbi:serine hydrolase domain-containing protein [Pseudomonas chlororaphis]|uniref:Beta-lactamase n=1 Tax=Pseudomonas chlororaphis TaxID=587753 RepID=A0AAX3FWK7_9PSED|nr:serine hydrolase domain-containing protein [Pseudomonas chlororaphis]AZC39400.1 Signal transduction histidine kinase CheA [Pseudomonas chlororaphis subsp. piscium]AZC45952.1 Signal transduction histidine kinase CheA [Pseudomonas chlororaphis subsp. piscium]WDG71487.1 serine hydrolase [Pseudomonas chlororaphis]WDH30729.1 serine hydrolase [Pseudomonas chlororaphis]WDH70012.1 serine hydrolase [Pseudomonas chlororaphis]
MNLAIKAAASGSDAVLITQNGKTLVDVRTETASRPIYLASVGKLLASFAVGAAIDRGLLSSIYQPISELFPEWRQGQKRAITIHNILAHRSGLQDEPNASLELEVAENVVRLALAAELSEPPGTLARYNNKAYALIAGLIEAATGERFEHFFASAFLNPMGITNVEWFLDRSGNAATYGAFALQVDDLWKFGELVNRNGRWGDRRLLSRKWIVTSMKPAGIDTPQLGLGWHMRSGQRILYNKQVNLMGYFHGGYRGNCLLVVPSANLVAVRLVSKSRFDLVGGDHWPSFVEDVLNLLVENGG